jgi:hypothetical protein
MPLFYTVYPSGAPELISLFYMSYMGFVLFMLWSYMFSCF